MIEKSKTKNKWIKNKKFKLFLSGGGAILALTSLISIEVNLEDKKTNQKSVSEQKYLSTNPTLSAAALQYSDPAGNSYTGYVGAAAVAAFNSIGSHVSYNTALESAGFTTLSLPSVVTIAANAFRLGTKLTSLSLPNVETISNNAFSFAKLTSLSLPKAQSIGDDVFTSSRLTSISLPKVTHIGRGAFGNTANVFTTKVNLPLSFNTAAQKNSIFGHFNWGQIDFGWYDAGGNLLDKDYEQGLVNNLLSIGATVTPANAAQPTKSPFDATTIARYGIKNADKSLHALDPQYTYQYTATATTIKIYVSKKGIPSSVTPIEIPISRNSFSGNFHSDGRMDTTSPLEYEKRFLAITTDVAANAFQFCDSLTSISLPDVTSVGSNSFASAPLTSLDLPNAEVIGMNGFTDAALTSLSLPSLTSVGDSAFANSPITNLYMPKVTSIGDSAFRSIPNEPSSKVTMHSSMNSVAQKNIMFGLPSSVDGVGTWDQIDFTFGNGLETDAQQVAANNLLSIGAIAEFEDMAQPTKAPLDAIAIAKYGIKNADTTSYVFNPKYTFEYTATDTAIKIYVSSEGSPASVEPVEIPISRNSFSGSFTTLAREKEFLAVRDRIEDYNGYNRFGFHGERSLRSISLPDTTYIGEEAFGSSPLTTIFIPSATHVGNRALFFTSNRATTYVTMLYTLNNGYILNDIFPPNDYGAINFIWVDENGNPINTVVNDEQDALNEAISMSATATDSNAVQATPTAFDNAAIAKYGIKNVDGTAYNFKSTFTYKYTATQTTITITVSKGGVVGSVGHEPVAINISPNSFSGSFTDIQKQKDFLGDITSMPANKYNNETGITSINIPRVTTIEDTAFENVTLTSIYMPTATTIGDSAFVGVDNVTTTNVTMQYKFCTDAEKDRIFGTSNWDQINFTLVDDDGNVVNATTLRTFLDSFSDATQAQTGDSATITAARTALENKINTLKNTYLDNNEIFNSTEKGAVIQLWNSLKSVWQTEMTSVLAHYKAESIKTTGDADVATARTILATGVATWESNINGITPATINTLTQTFNSDLTPLLNAVINKIKDYVSAIISNYIDSAVADPSDSVATATAKTSLRDAISEWNQKVTDATAATIDTIDALDAEGINIVQADLNVLQTAVFDAASSSSTGAINAEQTLINALLSMGATATTSNAVSPTPSLLDAAAIAKYGIKNADGTDYIFKSDFTYKYTATSTEITIVVTKNGIGSDSSHSPLAIVISPNSFSGTFTTLAKEKEFLAAIYSISASQFSTESGLSIITLPRVTSIGANAFDNSSAYEIKIPLAATIGDNAFARVENFPSTHVYMQYKFNTDAEKNRIFNSRWNYIDQNFAWYDSAGNEVIVTTLLNFLSPYISASQENSDDSVALAAKRLALEQKVTTLKRDMLDTYRLFGPDEQQNTIDLWDDFIAEWTTEMEGIIAPFETEGNKTTGNATVNATRSILKAAVTRWAQKVTAVTSSSISSVGKQQIENALTPLLNNTITKIKEMVTTIIGGYNGAALAVPGDSSETAAAKTSLREAIVDWTQKVTDATASTISTIDAENSAGVNIVKEALDTLKAAVDAAHASTTVAVNNEQTRINELLSMGATATPSNTEQISPVVFGPAAVTKYGIKNATGTPFAFNTDFIYTYTSTPTEITIVVTKNGVGSDAENQPSSIVVSPNSFTGTFNSLPLKKQFLGALNSVVPSQFVSADQLTSVVLPRVTSIGAHAFQNSPLTSINVPLSITIGDSAFSGVDNASTTHVTMQYKFNTNAEKNRIFGVNNWGNINFTWIDDKGIEVSVATLITFLDSFAKVTPANSDDSSALAAKRLALKQKIDILKVKINNNQVFGPDDKNAVTSLWESFKTLWTSEMTSIIAPFKAESIKTSGDSTVKATRALLSVQVSVWENKVSTITPLTFDLASKQQIENALTPLLNNTITKIKEMITNIIRDYDATAVAAPDDSTETATARTALRDAIADWDQKVTDATSSTINVIDAENAAKTTLVQVNLDLLKAQVDSAFGASTGLVNAEQTRINELLSMGATIDPSNIEQINKLTFDYSVASEYGIKKIDGSSYTLQSIFVYKYFATPTEITIIVSKNGIVADAAHAPVSILVSPNSFTGSFHTLQSTKDFLAGMTSITGSQFTGEDQLTSISLPRVTSIGAHAFQNSPLASINVPLSTTIGDSAFSGVDNVNTTNVTMQYKFNTDAEKNRIFGVNNWSNINFTWFDATGAEITNTSLAELLDSFTDVIRPDTTDSTQLGDARMALRNKINTLKNDLTNGKVFGPIEKQNIEDLWTAFKNLWTTKMNTIIAPFKAESIKTSGDANTISARANLTRELTIWENKVTNVTPTSYSGVGELQIKNALTPLLNTTIAKIKEMVTAIIGKYTNAAIAVPGDSTATATARTALRTSIADWAQKVTDATAATIGTIDSVNSANVNIVEANLATIKAALDDTMELQTAKDLATAALQPYKHLIRISPASEPQNLKDSRQAFKDAVDSWVTDIANATLATKDHISVGNITGNLDPLKTAMNNYINEYSKDELLKAFYALSIYINQGDLSNASKINNFRNLLAKDTTDPEFIAANTVLTEVNSIYTMEEIKGINMQFASVGNKIRVTLPSIAFNLTLGGNIIFNDGDIVDIFNSKLLKYLNRIPNSTRDTLDLTALVQSLASPTSTEWSLFSSPSAENNPLDRLLEGNTLIFTDSAGAAHEILTQTSLNALPTDTYSITLKKPFSGDFASEIELPSVPSSISILSQDDLKSFGEKLGEKLKSFISGSPGTTIASNLARLNTFASNVSEINAFVDSLDNSEFSSKLKTVLKKGSYNLAIITPTSMKVSVIGANLLKSLNVNFTHEAFKGYVDVTRFLTAPSGSLTYWTFIAGSSSLSGTINQATFTYGNGILNSPPIGQTYVEMLASQGLKMQWTTMSNPSAEKTAPIGVDPKSGWVDVTTLPLLTTNGQINGSTRNLFIRLISLNDAFEVSNNGVTIPSAVAQVDTSTLKYEIFVHNSQLSNVRVTGNTHVIVSDEIPALGTSAVAATDLDKIQISYRITAFNTVLPQTGTSVDGVNSFTKGHVYTFANKAEFFAALAKNLNFDKSTLEVRYSPKDTTTNVTKDNTDPSKPPTGESEEYMWHTPDISALQQFIFIDDIIDELNGNISVTGNNLKYDINISQTLSAKLQSVNLELEYSKDRTTWTPTKPTTLDDNKNLYVQVKSTSSDTIIGKKDPNKEEIVKLDTSNLKIAAPLTSAQLVFFHGLTISGDAEYHADMISDTSGILVPSSDGVVHTQFEYQVVRNDGTLSGFHDSLEEAMEVDPTTLTTEVAINRDRDNKIQIRIKIKDTDTSAYQLTDISGNALIESQFQTDVALDLLVETIDAVPDVHLLDSDGQSQSWLEWVKTYFTGEFISPTNPTSGHPQGILLNMAKDGKSIDSLRDLVTGQPMHDSFHLGENPFKSGDWIDRERESSLALRHSHFEFQTRNAETDPWSSWTTKPSATNLSTSYDGLRVKLVADDSRYKLSPELAAWRGEYKVVLPADADTTNLEFQRAVFTGFNGDGYIEHQDPTNPFSDLSIHYHNSDPNNIVEKDKYIIDYKVVDKNGNDVPWIDVDGVSHTGWSTTWETLPPSESDSFYGNPPVSLTNGQKIITRMWARDGHTIKDDHPSAITSPDGLKHFSHEIELPEITTLVDELTPSPDLHFINDEDKAIDVPTINTPTYSFTGDEGYGSIAVDTSKLPQNTNQKLLVQWLRPIASSGVVPIDFNNNMMPKVGYEICTGIVDGVPQFAKIASSTGSLVTWDAGHAPNDMIGTWIDPKIITGLSVGDRLRFRFEALPGYGYKYEDTSNSYVDIRSPKNLSKVYSGSAGASQDDFGIYVKGLEVMPHIDKTKMNLHLIASPGKSQPYKNDAQLSNDQESTPLSKWVFEYKVYDEANNLIQTAIGIKNIDRTNFVNGYTIKMRVVTIDPVYKLSSKFTTIFDDFQISGLKNQIHAGSVPRPQINFEGKAGEGTVASISEGPKSDPTNTEPVVHYIKVPGNPIAQPQLPPSSIAGIEGDASVGWKYIISAADPAALSETSLKLLPVYDYLDDALRHLKNGWFIKMIMVPKDSDHFGIEPAVMSIATSSQSHSSYGDEWVQVSGLYVFADDVDFTKKIVGSKIKNYLTTSFTQKTYSEDDVELEAQVTHPDGTKTEWREIGETLDSHNGDKISFRAVLVNGAIADPQNTTDFTTVTEKGVSITYLQKDSWKNYLVEGLLEQINIDGVEFKNEILFVNDQPKSAFDPEILEKLNLDLNFNKVTRDELTGEILGYGVVDGHGKVVSDDLHEVIDFSRLNSAQKEALNKVTIEYTVDIYNPNSDSYTSGHPTTVIPTGLHIGDKIHLKLIPQDPTQYVVSTDVSTNIIARLFRIPPSGVEKIPSVQIYTDANGNGHATVAEDPPRGFKWQYRVYDYDKTPLQGWSDAAPAELQASQFVKVRIASANKDASNVDQKESDYVAVQIDYNPYNFSPPNPSDFTVEGKMSGVGKIVPKNEFPNYPPEQEAHYIYMVHRIVDGEEKIIAPFSALPPSGLENGDIVEIKIHSNLNSDSKFDSKPLIIEVEGLDDRSAQSQLQKIWIGVGVGAGLILTLGTVLFVKMWKSKKIKKLI